MRQALAIWPYYTSSSTSVRGRPAAVDGIDDRIANYKLAGPHSDVQILEFIGELCGRAPPIKFVSSAVTRNTMPRYLMDKDLISFRYLVEISAIAVHHLGVHHVSGLSIRKYGNVLLFRPHLFSL